MTLTEEKILNGIKYFVIKTHNVGRTKLFKLLYFWDFMHFKKYGMNATGYEYYKYPFGPVTKQLYIYIINEKLPEFLHGKIAIIEDDLFDEDDGYKKFKVVLERRSIDYSCFSPNELSVLQDVACIFKEATAKEMTEITHLPNSPWYKTVKEGMDIPINYFLALDDETTLDRDEVEELFILQKEMLADGRH